jgi:hypothetical protein
MQFARPGTAPACRVAYRWDLVHHGRKQDPVRGIGRGQGGHQRPSLPLGQQVKLDPGLPRSTGFAPTWSPSLGAHAPGIHAGPGPVSRPATPKRSRISAWSCSNTPAATHSSNRRRTVESEPQPSSLAGSSRQRGGGAGHVHHRGDAVAVGDGPGPAAHQGRVELAARAQ